jgi:hypothetical protein
LKKYITNKDLVKEIIVSKAQGKRTPELERMLVLLAKRTILKMSYRDQDDKLDCLQSGVLKLLENWWKFDDDLYQNAFAFYTEIFKRAIANEFNRLNYKDRLTGRYVEFVGFEYINDEGRNENWI